MKITALLGSPRAGGNSASMAMRFIEQAAKLGAETTVFQLNRMSYKGCQGCYACKKTLNHCVLKDDLTEALNSVKDADVVFLASPVYFSDISAQLKGFIDRTYSYLKPDYITNSEPSRLAPKKLFFALSQGQPDTTLFTDIFPRYSSFLKWMGFSETTLIRACGIGPASVDEVPEQTLQEIDAAVSRLFEV